MVTSYSEEQRPAEERLEHYRQRGTFEDRLGEFRQWIGPKLSSQEFESNEATLLLSLLAFNLANMLRCELEDGAGACWDLGRFQKSVLKAGGRIVKKAGRVIVDLAAAVVPLWERLVARLNNGDCRNDFPYRVVLPTGDSYCPRDMPSSRGSSVNEHCPIRLSPPTVTLVAGGGRGAYALSTR